MSTSIEQAAHILDQGGLVAFPTETVYGLGADAQNPVAIANIYAAKGRPANHPVIVHIAPEADLAFWASDIPTEAYALINAFWPGPLTLILKRAAHIPDAVSGGQNSIGIRCPSHPVALALLRSFKNGQGGIAAPSANKFGRVSPTTAQHVRDEFKAELQPNGLVKAVLDGEQSEVGIESTIVDLTRLSTHGAVLLRPGHINLEQLASVLGYVPARPNNDINAPRASGTLEAHYAPNTPVVMLENSAILKTLEQLNELGKKVALMSISDFKVAAKNDHNALSSVIHFLQLPDNPLIYAHELYVSLRQLDNVNADVIVVEKLPPQVGWNAVNDRLNRAAFDARGLLKSWIK